MAERPDLDYYVPILNEALTQAQIQAVEVKKPVVMRVAVEGTPEALLPGHTIRSVRRRAHFIVFDLDTLELVVIPMLAGRFVFAEKKLPGDAACVFTLKDGRRLVY